MELINFTSKSARPIVASDSIQLRDLWGLCIARWPWFVVSLVVCVGAAMLYLKTTPPVYTRSTSLLIKEEGRNRNSFSSQMSSMGNFGMFTDRTNVNNELISIQSPDMVQEVVRRLSLNVGYETDGLFHRETLYGRTLPIKVEFTDLSPNDFCSFCATIGSDSSVVLSDMTLNGGQPSPDARLTVRMNREVKTPIGRLKVVATPYYKERAKDGMPVYVNRISTAAAVGGCRGSLSAALNDEGSTIIDITYTDVNTQRAEEVLNTLISVYNENWVKDKNQIAVSTSQFINERLVVIESELGNVDSDISSYKSANLIPDVAAASQMYMQNANQASVQISDLNNQLYMARYIREHVNDKHSKDQLLPANSGIASSTIDAQIAAYNEKMLQRNSLVANSSDKNPIVVDMDKSLDEMRSAIVSSIDNEVNTLNTQIRGLRGIQGASQSRLSSNPQQAKYLLSVERQQKVKESLYLFLLQKREENELSQAFTAYNTRVIVSPTGSMAPSAPNSRSILIAAIVIGLLIPLAIIFLREMLNTTVRGRKDIEQLTMPFIGEIPQHGRKKRRYPWQRSQTDSQPSRIVVKPRSRNVINEAFRVVRTNMEFMAGADRTNKVVMLTSINPGSGKTFLSINIATSFAIKEQRVIVVDLDMRRASLSEYVGSPELGIADYLNGKVNDWRDIRRPVEGYDHLEVIPVGTIPPNPAELLFSKRLQQMLDELRQQYDLIILDCPPVEVVADASVIAKHADTTVFVVRAGLMEREMLPVIEGYYQSKKYQNMCMLLNGTISTGRHYSYHYGYNYGYGGKSYGGYTKDDE